MPVFGAPRSSRRTGNREPQTVNCEPKKYSAAHASHVSRAWCGRPDRRRERAQVGSLPAPVRSRRALPPSDGAAGPCGSGLQPAAHRARWTGFDFAPRAAKRATTALLRSPWRSAYAPALPGLRPNPQPLVRTHPFCPRNRTLPTEARNLPDRLLVLPCQKDVRFSGRGARRLAARRTHASPLARQYPREALRTSTLALLALCLSVPCGSRGNVCSDVQKLWRAGICCGSCWKTRTQIAGLPSCVLF